MKIIKWCFTVFSVVALLGLANVGHAYEVEIQNLSQDIARLDGFYEYRWTTPGNIAEQNNDECTNLNAGKMEIQPGASFDMRNLIEGCWYGIRGIKKVVYFKKTANILYYSTTPLDKNNVSNISIYRCYDKEVNGVLKGVVETRTVSFSTENATEYVGRCPTLTRAHVQGNENGLDQLSFKLMP